MSDIECVNKRIVGRTRKEYRQDKKVEISEKAKQYREANKKNISERDKKYRDDNNIKISEQRKERILCECCKTEILKHHRARHERTVKHIHNYNSCNITINNAP